MEETARAAASVFRSILELKQRIEQEVLPRFSVRRQDNAQTFIRNLYDQPVIGVKWVAEITGASINTTSALVTDMVSHGVLIEATGQRRNRLFVFGDYISLFRR